MTLQYFATKGLFFNYELHLRCEAAGDPNSQQHAGDLPLQYLPSRACFLIMNSTSGVEQQMILTANNMLVTTAYSRPLLGLFYLIVNSTSDVELQVILTANNTLVTSHSSTLPSRACLFNYELHLRCGAPGDTNRQQHAGDEPLQYFAMKGLFFNYELHLRCGAPGDTNSQQQANDGGLFQNLCYLGLVYLIVNSTSGVERQVILTANTTPMTAAHSRIIAIYCIGLIYLINYELYLNFGAAGDSKSQQHAGDPLVP
jgi:hypothetical protein